MCVWLPVWLSVRLSGQLSVFQASVCVARHAHTPNTTCKLVSGKLRSFPHRARLLVQQGLPACQLVCLCTCMCTSLPASLHTHCLLMRLSVCLSVRPSVCLSVRPSFCMSVPKELATPYRCPSWRVHLERCLSMCLSVCLHVCVQRAGHSLQVSFLAYAFGGGVGHQLNFQPRYKGRDLAFMHSHMVEKGLTMDHFDAVLKHFCQTLRQLNMPQVC